MALYIETKQKGFTGTKNGVRFLNGKARVPKAVAQELVKKGICYCPQLGVERPVAKRKKKNDRKDDKK